MSYVIATTKPWHRGLPKLLESIVGEKFFLIEDKEELQADYLRTINPKYIFFPHWSYIIPSEIYNNFECVVFHMTDLPFGRGGSPLQNLIARGIYETKISALKCDAGIDSGPIYLKRNLSLYGNAEEIYIRTRHIITDMIVEIIKKQLCPVSQKGEITVFNRRKPEESSVREINSLEKLHDHIRMLDAEGYPKAFIENEYFIFEFSRSSLKDGHIIADVKITKKEQLGE